MSKAASCFLCKKINRKIVFLLVNVHVFLVNAQNDLLIHIVFWLIADGCQLAILREKFVFGKITLSTGTAVTGMICSG